MSEEEEDQLSSGTPTDNGEPSPIDDIDHAELPPPFRAYIGCLSRSVGTEELTRFLQKHDPNVSHVHVAKNKLDGSCRGFAHCSFSTDALRMRAISELTGATFNGRKVRLETAGEHFTVVNQREGKDAMQKPQEKQPKRAAAEADWSSYNTSSYAAPSWQAGRVPQGSQKRWDPNADYTAKPASSGETELERQKAAAVAREDYAEAARLKKLIDGMSGKLHELQQRKQAAVASEDYAEAARLKSEIDKLGSGGAEPQTQQPQAAAKPEKNSRGKPKQPPLPKLPPPSPSKCPRCTTGKVCSTHGSFGSAAPVNPPLPTTAHPTTLDAQPAPAAEAAAVAVADGAAPKCKRCMTGKPCSKHSAGGAPKADNGPRCRKCAAGQPCMKHNPEAALKEMQQQQQQPPAPQEQPQQQQQAEPQQQKPEPEQQQQQQQQEEAPQAPEKKAAASPAKRKAAAAAPAAAAAAAAPPAKKRKPAPKKKKVVAAAPMTMEALLGSSGGAGFVACMDDDV
ncbi:hypothetical protein DIPPA_04267 [Diplonema papillatum]|nr:hypothetical protein DIPPA_04267 [Diplonema papillatum]|eukprot:gene2473-3837_t